ncbi:PLP-dependent aminotransferase family protein [Cohnella mopanensis]|uniref:aminotransferase-like domain-containing protein n=1 Tax=Cohnella mopanensis TaxID=2911966 RepID=UPI001EF7B97F|nr:PLP-dependent aminotransferase family protein [Cohnella mopanensis]
MDTKHEQIVKHLLREMEEGSIKPGVKLPSIRDVAERFRCSPNTVARAYQTLERQDLVYSVSKSGYYIVETKATASAVLSPPTFNFASVMPRGDFLPFQDFEHCLRQAVSLYKEELFGYTDPQGILSLRAELQRHLNDHQIFANTDQICVVTGAQQAFAILTRMPFPVGGGSILIEQPTYFGFMDTANLHGCRIVGLQRDEDGIDLERLESYFRSGDIKFFYTVPRFLNPLGASYRTEQKKRIVELADKYNVYIVEDDYLADLEDDTKSDPLFAMDQNSRVIYIKSFSKTTLPGLRLGVTVLPKSLVQPFVEYKKASDISSPILSQGALEIYLKCGMFKRHAAKIRSHYRDKMSYAVEMCGRLLGDRVSWTSPSSGVFITLTLPNRMRASVLIEQLNLRGIYATNVDQHLLPEFRQDNRIRLCIIGVEKSQIAAGFALISDEIKRIGRR